MNNNYYAKLAKNKSLLKEYCTVESQRTVYLNDGDDFQIQLFNPEREEIGVRISIESSQLSHDIVLRPGERIWLERYTDTPRKFRFNTYYIDSKVKEAKDAIADNGIVQIQFFHKKKESSIFVNVPNITWTYFNQSQPNYTITCGDGYTEYSSSTSAINSIFNETSFTLNANAAMPTSSIKYTEPNSTFASTNVEENTSLETGRIMEGGHSKQRFDNVDIEFEWMPFKTEIIKILPESRKTYNSNDLRKVYCPSCGRKLKTNYKYCPYCGEKLD